MSSRELRFCELVFDFIRVVFIVVSLEVVIFFLSCVAIVFLSAAELCMFLSYLLFLLCKFLLIKILILEFLVLLLLFLAVKITFTSFHEFFLLYFRFIANIVTCAFIVRVFDFRLFNLHGLISIVCVFYFRLVFPFVSDVFDSMFDSGTQFLLEFLKF